MRRRPLMLIVGAAAVVVAIVITLVTVLRTKPPVTKSTPTVATTKIPVSDGAQLAAHVFVPAGGGKHPLLIMPAPWGQSADPYVPVDETLVKHGYVVVAYAQRGFGTSQGQIDLGGATTQADVSAVITWALAHTPADPKAVGCIGVSYGAGISLMAAEKDPRIKAVVAMSTWTDLAASYYPNETPSVQAVNSLFGSATTVQRLSPPVAEFHSDFARQNVGGAAARLYSLAPERSPATGVAALNRNHPAVMIANDFQDAFFPPSQLISFFDQLAGPKRLQLAAGDHGGQETPGMEGRPSKVWDDATAWVDHFLRGVSNGVQSQGAVQLNDLSM